jgi:hypothetical protein
MATTKVAANSGRDGRGRFGKGSKKPPKSGRRKGTPNKATKAWKDFVKTLVTDPDQQQALAEAIRKRPELLFKAAEHAHGKPRQSVDVDQVTDNKIVYCWKDDRDDD